MLQWLKLKRCDREIHIYFIGELRAALFMRPGVNQLLNMQEIFFNPPFGLEQRLIFSMKLGGADVCQRWLKQRVNRSGVGPRHDRLRCTLSPAPLEIRSQLG